jgi:hypothetical protein
MNKNFLIVAVLILLVVGGYAFLPKPNETIETRPYCTLEAMMCPDGSYVGRDGPDCEFAECPALKPEILKIKNESCIYSDWQLEWNDTHILFGGMNILVCEDEVLLKVRNRDEQNERMYSGTLSLDTHSDLYKIAETITSTNVSDLPADLPETLPPDASIVELYIEQGGDGHTYHFLFNNRTDEMLSLYNKLQEIRQQIEK